MFGINKSRYDEFKARLPEWAPETEIDTPRGVMDVDVQRRREGAQPTTLGRAIETEFLRPKWGDPNEADAAERGAPMAPPSPSLFRSALETGARAALGPAGIVGQALFSGGARQNRADALARVESNPAYARVTRDMRERPENFLMTPGGAIGSLDDVGKAAKGAGDAISQGRKLIRGLSGFNRQELRAAENELTRAMEGGSQALTPRSREIIGKALGEDFVSKFQPLTRRPDGTIGRAVSATKDELDEVLEAGEAAARKFSPPRSPNTRWEPQGLTSQQRANQRFAASRQAERAAEEARRNAPAAERNFSPPRTPNTRWEPEGVTATQRSNQRFAARSQAEKAAEAARREAEFQAEMTKPDGWWKNRAPQLTPEGNSARTRMINEVAARRRAMDKVIQASGQKPEPTGVGKVAQIVGETLRASQRLMLGGEVSAVTRQGGRLNAGHPLDSAKAWGKALPLAFKKPEVAKAVDDGIKNSWEGKLFTAAGGKFREAGDAAGDIAISNFPNNVWFLGRWYRGTEQASITGLNAQAANVFRTFVKNNWEQIAPGLDFDTYAKSNVLPTQGMDVDMLKRMADVITVAQGRSPWLAKNAGEYVSSLNAAFLAPHWRISRAQQLGMDLKSLANITSDAALRQQIDPISKEIAKNAVAYYSSGVGLLTLGAMAGANVGTDRNASNFGKIDVGPVSYDMWGGNAQIIRMIAQMANGEIHTRNGSVRDVNRLKPLADWLRGGLGVGPGLAVDYAMDETLAGEKFNWKDAITRRVTAIIAQDVQEAIDAEMGVRGLAEGGLLGAAQSVPFAMAGWGVNRIKSPTQQALDKEAGGDFSKLPVQEQQRILKEKPELAAQLQADRDKASGTIGKVEEIRKIYQKSQANIDAQLDSGELTAEQWYGAAGDLEREVGILIANEYRQAGSKPLDPKAKEGETPKDWYGRVIAANTNPNDPKDVNWDAVESWRASLTPEQDKYIDDHTNSRPLSEKAAERAQFKRELRQSGYWDLREQAWSVMAKQPAFQKALKGAEDYQSWYRDRVIEVQAAMVAGGIPAGVAQAQADAAAQQHPLFKAYQSLLNNYEMRWVGKNTASGLADKAVLYGLFTPTKDQRTAIATYPRATPTKP